VINYNNSLF